MKIEQAIFTSARTQHGAGYQLVAQSSGVTAEQARELAIWGPSHDALDPTRDEQSSVNFHHLACGTYCISKTVASGEEYSSRGGARVYTQFLLVPPAVLARFENNPFAVLRAAWAKGVLAVCDDLPSALEPFTLAGRASLVDEGLLAQLANQLGPDRVGGLVSAALLPGVKLLAGATHYETMLGGLLNFLPVECRSELTFTTGLRFSPRRPFQLGPCVGETVKCYGTARQEGLTVIDMSLPSCGMEIEHNGWAVYVAELIRSDELHRLVTDLQQPRLDLSLVKLNQLGEQLLDEIHAAPINFQVHIDQRLEQTNPEPSAPDLRRKFRTDRPIVLNSTDADLEMHKPVVGSKSALSMPSIESPGIAFAADSQEFSEMVADPAVSALLTQLDEAVCQAISGSGIGIENTTRIWSQICGQLQPSALSEVREQYLRYAISLWHSCNDEGRQPQRTIDILNLLEVMFQVE
ncbi:MAG TPA: hypothetical protein VGJ04_01455 [Pirellulales bacterium]